MPPEDPRTPDELEEPLIPEQRELLNSFFASINADLDEDGNLQEPITEVYFQRWLILALFSLLAFTQSVIWITWSTIYQSAISVYGWSDNMIPLLLNWGNIPYVFLSVPICWFLNRYGLRKTTLVATFLMVLGSGIRCLSFNPRNATPMIHVGQMLNGISGVVYNGVPSQLSAVWFPTHERTTATSITLTFASMGVAGAYILGPALVNDFHQKCDLLPKTRCHNSTITALQTEKHQIVMLLLYEFGAAAILFLLAIFFFKEKPKKPPTASATLERLDFKDTFSNIRGNLNFWVIAMGLAVSNGISSNWLGILPSAVDPLGIGQKEAGSLGTYSTLIGCASSLIIARLIDMVGGYIKLTLIIVWIVCGANFVFYTLMYLHIIPHYTSYLYSSVLITGILAYSGIPLYMELSAEVTYPVSEGVVGVILQTMVNIVGTIFLGLFLIPNIGVGWMNWCLISSAVIGLILVILQKENYQRSNFDKLAEEYQSVIEDPDEV